MVLEPEAWLIRETTASGSRVMCGEMFKRADTANAAALRLTNRWRTCIAFPVVSLAVAQFEIEQRDAYIKTVETAS